MPHCHVSRVAGASALLLRVGAQAITADPIDGGHLQRLTGRADPSRFLQRRPAPGPAGALMPPRDANYRLLDIAVADQPPAGQNGASFAGARSVRRCAWAEYDHIADSGRSPDVDGRSG